MKIPSPVLKFPKDLVAQAVPNSKGYCVIGLALRALAYERIQVTADYITACRRYGDVIFRFVWPTPRRLAVAAIEFDTTDGKAGWPVTQYQLRGVNGAFSEVVPRPYLVGHKARGATKPRKAGRICVRRWRGKSQFVQHAVAV